MHGCEHIQLTYDDLLLYNGQTRTVAEREGASRLSTHRLRCRPRAQRGTRHQDGLTDWLADWLIDWLTDLQTNWLTDWLTDLQTDRLTDWLTDWQTDRKTDRMSNLLTDWPPVVTRLSVWLWSLSLYSHEFHFTACANRNGLQKLIDSWQSQTVAKFVVTQSGECFRYLTNAVEQFEVHEKQTECSLYANTTSLNS
jgi:hypothetical protein